MLHTIRNSTSGDPKFQEDVLTPTPGARGRGLPGENPKYLGSHYISSQGSSGINGFQWDCWTDRQMGRGWINGCDGPMPLPPLSSKMSLTFHAQLAIATPLLCSHHFPDWITGAVGLLQWPMTLLKTKNVSLILLFIPTLNREVWLHLHQ